MPAPGYRSAASAVLGAVGADSHAWASSSFLVGSYTAGNYYGGATRMVPLKDDNRAFGFPVRCVQHLSEPFVSVRHPDLEVIEQGSSYKFCMLAEGRVDYYVRTSRTYEWDTAAGELILAEAGGSTRTLPDDRALRYNEEDLRNPWFVCRSKYCRI